jgi:putative endonuclease
MSRDVEKMFYVYLVADRSRVLYVGFTSNLRGRVIQHRDGWFEGFTKSYDCHRLVWFERFSTASAGIAREKQIKRWRREKKVALIERENPTWEDLSLQSERANSRFLHSGGKGAAFGRNDGMWLGAKQLKTRRGIAWAIPLAKLGCRCRRSAKD